ncbi:hypothetical protein ACNKHW_13655 [Shigella flexneri]
MANIPILPMPAACVPDLKPKAMPVPAAALSYKKQKAAQMAAAVEMAQND